MRMQGTDRRQQLIETALDVFSRKGFDGATTKEIAVEAGVVLTKVMRHIVIEIEEVVSFLQQLRLGRCTPDDNKKLKTKLSERVRRDFPYNHGAPKEPVRW